MKNKTYTVSILLASAAMTFSGLLTANTNTLQVGVGYRQDSATTTIGQRGALNPRAKSKLHYRDIEIVFLGLNGKTSFDCCNNSYLRGSFDYGWVLDGKLREWLTVKNRSCGEQFCSGGFGETGRSLNVLLHNKLSTSSYVWDLDLGFVYPFNCGCSRDFLFGPGIGITVNTQHVRVKNDVTVNQAEFSEDILDEFNLNGGCGKNRNRITWWGPWIGFDFAYNSCDCWSIYGEVELHIGRVRQTRQSNVENSFIDRRKSTKSYCGPSFKLGTSYMFCQNWFMDASIFYSKYWSFNSRNDLRWATGNIRLDVGYLF